MEKNMEQKTNCEKKMGTVQMTPEAREQKAKKLEEMAACLRSTKSNEECCAAMAKCHQEMFGEKGCGNARS